MGDTLERLSSGAPHEQAGLIAERGALAYGLALAMPGGDEQTAREAFAEALRGARENPAAKPAAMPLRSWLCVLVRHEMINRARGSDHASMHLPQFPPAPDDPLVGLSLIVDRKARTLDPARAEALRRVWLRGEDYAAMARYFQIPLGQVRGWFAPVFDHWRPAQLGDAAELEALAGEYALGLLSKEEAAAIEGVMGHEPSLAQNISAWTILFAGLADESCAEAPPCDLCLSLSDGAPARSGWGARLWKTARPALWGAAAAGLVLGALSLAQW